MKQEIKNESDITVAFVESQGHSLGETKLHPYTPSRMVAAQAMGLKYPYIGEAAHAHYLSTGIYSGEQSDMIIVLGLCRLEDKEIAGCRLNPEAAYAEAEKWATKIGLVGNMRSPAFKDAREVFWKILNEIEESRTEIDRAGGARQSPEDEDPNE